MNKITSDWHIHTHCSCDSACMEFESLVQDAKKLGLTDFGVSDHYHTRIQEPDIAASRKEYELTLEKHPELKGHFYFGIEATIVSEWEVGKIARGEYDELPVYGFRYDGPSGDKLLFDFNDEFIEKYKIDYVVAAMHYPMYCERTKEAYHKEYHRQYMYAASHPYADILAHYTWYDPWLFPDFKNPFYDFSSVSETMRDELKHALIENKVAFEFNPDSIFNSSNLSPTFADEYLGWAADLQKSGVVISFGSDVHAPHLKKESFDLSEAKFKHYGIDPSKFFNLSK